MPCSKSTGLIKEIPNGTNKGYRLSELNFFHRQKSKHNRFLFRQNPKIFIENESIRKNERVFPGAGLRNN